MAVPRVRLTLAAAALAVAGGGGAYAATHGSSARPHSPATHSPAKVQRGSTLTPQSRVPSHHRCHEDGANSSAANDV